MGWSPKIVQRSRTKLVLYSMRLKVRARSAKIGSTLAIQTLADLPMGQPCILDHLELPEDIARRLMELGFLPGTEVIATRRAPGGGPRVFRVDGSEVALRHETAARVYIRRNPESDLIVLL